MLAEPRDLHIRLLVAVITGFRWHGGDVEAVRRPQQQDRGVRRRGVASSASRSSAIDPPRPGLASSGPQPPSLPGSVALHWPIESPAPPALSNLVLGTSSSLVAFPLTSRPAAPPSRAALTPAPPPPAPATAPPVPPAVRHRVPHRSTTTHARRAPMSSSILGPAADSAARPGSCRKPPSLLYVKSGKESDLLAFSFVVRWELTTFLRSGGAPRTAVHVVGPGGCPIGLRTQPRNEKVLSLCRQGPNAVERAAIVPEVVGHASAGRSSPNGRPPSFTAAVAQIGRHPSEWPHATPPGSPRSWPGCPAAPTRSSSGAPPPGPRTGSYQGSGQVCLATAQISVQNLEITPGPRSGAAKP
jgi:hypothetical protein